MLVSPPSQKLRRGVGGNRKIEEPEMWTLQVSSEKKKTKPKTLLKRSWRLFWGFFCVLFCFHQRGAFQKFWVKSLIFTMTGGI